MFFCSQRIVSTTSFKAQYLYVDETKIKLKKIFTIFCNSTFLGRSMHVRLKATLIWSMPLDCSGITHDAIGKNWPDLHIFKSTTRSHDPRCLRTLYFSHAYASSMTLVYDKGTLFFKVTTLYLACFNLLAFFSYALTLFSTNWKWDSHESFK